MTQELTKVDFYILPSADPAARLDFACKLTDKAWRLGHRVYLHCSDAAQRQDLDERLWCFKGESFVPHSSIFLIAATALYTGGGSYFCFEPTRQRAREAPA